MLEIGCGVGRVGASLAPRCARWIGADVSAEMLRHARAALAGHANVSLVHLNGVDLAGVDDASVDVAYCTGVFMHLDEWERYRYLAEAFRVLRPGGRVYVDNINLLSPEGWTHLHADDADGSAGAAGQRQQDVDAGGAVVVRDAGGLRRRAHARRQPVDHRDRAQAGSAGYAGGRGLKP